MCYINVKTWSNGSEAWDIVTWNLFIAEPGNVKLESISTEMSKLRFQLGPVSCKLDRQHDERRNFIFCLTSHSLSGNQKLKVSKLYFDGCGLKLTITMMKLVIKCIFTKAGDVPKYKMSWISKYFSRNLMIPSICLEIWYLGAPVLKYLGHINSQLFIL